MLFLVGRLWQLLIFIKQVAWQFTSLAYLLLDASLVSRFDLLLQLLRKLLLLVTFGVVFTR